MDIMLKGNNGEKVVIPIEDLIQKYWSDENSKPNRIEMSATVKDLVKKPKSPIQAFGLRPIMLKAIDTVLGSASSCRTIPTTS